MFWGTWTLVTMSGWYFSAFLWHLSLLGLKKISLSSVFFPTLNPCPPLYKDWWNKKNIFTWFFLDSGFFRNSTYESPILVNGVRFIMWFLYLFICQIIEKEPVALRSKRRIQKIRDFRAGDSSTHMGWLSQAMELSSPSCLGILNGTTLQQGTSIHWRMIKTKLHAC